MTRTTNPYFAYCRYCGREYDAAGMGTHHRARHSSGQRVGANTGFVMAASDKHESLCETKSPAQRRATNARDEARWKKSPLQACRITNNPNHPGLKDQP